LSGLVEFDGNGDRATDLYGLSAALEPNNHWTSVGDWSEEGFIGRLPITSLAFREGRFVLEWVGEPGRIYAVEFSRTLDNWTQIGVPLTDPENPGVIEFMAPNAKTDQLTGFYRIRRITP
jgi:hypothetical protein